MQAWVHRALEKWPDVPAVFGWLALDGRGHWWLRGERINRRQIIDTIAANYACDDRGRWFYQNGPQRCYVQLATAPLIVRVDDDHSLHSHVGHPIDQADAAYLDEHGALWLQTTHGAAIVDGDALNWALDHLSVGDTALDDEALLNALSLGDGATTALQLHLGASRLPVLRLDVANTAAHLGFVREPTP